jgi:hypothetical protein
MPILAYENYGERETIVRIINQATKGTPSDPWKLTLAAGRKRGNRLWSEPSQASKDRSRFKEVADLINGYISPPEDIGPLHCRRTLDQYSYYMLDTTERRDKDQVVYRWVKNRDDPVRAHAAGDKMESVDPQKPIPILMVDQLWLWVLPDGNHAARPQTSSGKVVSDSHRNRHYRVAEHAEALREVQYQEASQRRDRDQQITGCHSRSRRSCRCRAGNLS